MQIRSIVQASSRASARRSVRRETNVQNTAFAALAFVASTFAALLTGCGPSQAGFVDMPLDASAGDCVDEDGDGFGDGCEAGADCDDTDPTIHDGCKAPPPPPDCTSGETRTCKVQLPMNGMVASCFVGIERCKDQRWSGECEKDEHVQSH